MLDMAHPVDPDSGLLNLVAGFDSLASYAFVRGRDPSLRSSASWFESSRRHFCSRSLMVNDGALSRRKHGFDSRREYEWKVRSVRTDTGLENRVTRERPGSTPTPSAFRH